MKKTFICTILLFSYLLAYTMPFSNETDGLKTNIDGMQVEIQFYTEHIVRIVKRLPQSSTPYHSFSVIKNPEKIVQTLKENANSFILESSDLKIHLDKSTGKIIFENKEKATLLSEKDYGAQFTPVEYGKYHSYLARQAFRLETDETIYGLGQHQKGKMSQRNQRLLLKQKNTEICIPYFLSQKGYGLFWDTPSVTTFTDNPQETAFESQAEDYIAYYFIYGGNADNTTRLLRDLTGQAPMNALWTYGFWQSKERYKTQEEIVGVVKKYRDLNIPLDGIIQDWRYWGKTHDEWNALKFGSSDFSNPDQMIQNIHKQNAHIAISVWPSFGGKTEIGKELKQQDLLLDFETFPKPAKVYDVYNPKSRDIYWKYMRKGLFSKGIDGWWLDATEPENKSGDEVLNQSTHAGLFRQYYNAFPLLTVENVYKRQRKETSDKRVFILTRSAFAGQQRCAATSWSGDIKASWDVLRKQIPAGLNFSICGIPYWNTDIGGFFTYHNYKKGVKDPSYRELYVRWNQFGTFTPMMRSHGTNTPREIYQFGEQGSWEFESIKRFICLRYLMLPYNYSTAWQVTHNGYSFMRALFMDFPEDQQVLDMDNEYMFGKSLLIAPVTESMYVDSNKAVTINQIKSKEIYLPSYQPGWYDFWTGKQVEGGQMVKRNVPINEMPIYVKAGSILPIGPKVQYANEKKWNNLEIRIYRGADGEFVLYEDENDNYNYEKGVYSSITFKWNDKNKRLTVEERKGEFPGMLKKRRFNIVLVDETKGLGDAPLSIIDKKVTYRGKKITLNF